MATLTFTSHAITVLYALVAAVLVAIAIAGGR